MRAAEASGGSRLVAVQQAGVEAQPRRGPAFTPIGVGLAIVLVAIVAAIGIQMLLSTWPPVSAGQSAAVVGEVTPCNEAEVDEDGASTCYAAPFQEGRDVGMGFSVRNDGLLPMTIVAVDVIRDGVLTPAQLEPYLSTTEGPSGPDIAPFQPVEVAPGSEQTIQFMGTFGNCETVARDYVPGSGLVLGQAFLTLRWAFFETQAEVPLPVSLALSAPTSCP